MKRDPELPAGLAGGNPLQQMRGQRVRRNVSDEAGTRISRLFETAVHEGGHAFGLSNITDLLETCSQTAIPWPDWFDPFSRAIYVASHPTIAPSVMDYDFTGHNCSPNPFDVLAIFALYQVGE